MQYNRNIVRVKQLLQSLMRDARYDELPLCLTLLSQNCELVVDALFHW